MLDKILLDARDKSVMVTKLSFIAQSKTWGLEGYNAW